MKKQAKLKNWDVSGKTGFKNAFIEENGIWDEVLDRDLSDGLLEEISETEAEKIITEILKQEKIAAWRLKLLKIKNNKARAIFRSRFFVYNLLDVIKSYRTAQVLAQELLAQATEKLGISYGAKMRVGFITHDARHTAVIRMLQVPQIDPSTVGALMGHSDSKFNPALFPRDARKPKSGSSSVKKLGCRTNEKKAS